MLAQRLLLSSISLLIANPAIYAAVSERDFQQVGDGLLTYDEVNQKEWLDLTETLDLPLDELRAALSDTGSLNGFSLATEEDIAELAASAGVEWLPPGKPFPVIEGSSARELIDMVGAIIDYSNAGNNTGSGVPQYIYDDNGDIVGIIHDFDDIHEIDPLESLGLRAAAGLATIGLPHDELPENSFELFSVVSIGDSTPTGMIHSPLITPTEGGGILSRLIDIPEPITGPYWLVRTAVPEPNTCILLVLGALILANKRKGFID